MVYPSLTAGLMESYQIFGTAEKLAYVRKKATNQMKLSKIIWDEAPNVAESATNESEVA